MSNDWETLGTTLPETQHVWGGTDHNDKVQQKFVERGASPLARGHRVGAFAGYNLRRNLDI
jgi:hypothetical protein